MKRKRRRPRSQRWDLRSLRRAASRSQGGLCYWCGQAMSPPGDEADPLSETGDHLVPRYQGGLTRPGNIVAACRRCKNQRCSETNRMKKQPGTSVVASAGDPAPASPFDVLRRYHQLTPADKSS